MSLSMSLTRSAAILIAVLALLGVAVPASAATSRLTLNPPVTLRVAVPPQPPAGRVAPPADVPASGLPRTGTDLPAELLLAAVLLGAGGLLRMNWSSSRS